MSLAAIQDVGSLMFGVGFVNAPTVQVQSFSSMF
jgi:hypothetical protein